MDEKKIMLSVDEIKDGLSPVFEDESLLLVLLFGSVATGNAHRHSDIDLAFLFDTPVDILELTNRVIRLLHNDDVDVIDLRHAKPLLKYSVAKNGLVIYEKMAGIYNQFYSLAFRRFVDTRKLRDARETYINNFLKSKGLA